MAKRREARTPSPAGGHPLLYAAVERRGQLAVAEHLDLSIKQLGRLMKGENQIKPAYLALLSNESSSVVEAQIAGLRFVDLFAGIGGLRRGFEAAGGTCVFTSEWDRYAVRTYRANFPETHDIAGDITSVNADEIPPHDILLAGFPCQPFSLAGVSKKNSLGRSHGFLDKVQGTLFFDVVRILKEHRPKGFLLENVKNLQGHDGGKTYRVIRDSLELLGYHVTDRVIDSSPWVPQRRQRIFLVGFSEPVRFSFREMAVPQEGPTLGTVLHRSDEEPELRFTQRVKGKTLVDPRYTLSDHLWKYLQDYAAKHRAAGNGFGCSVFDGDDVARTLSARYHKDGSEILIRQRGKNPRRLTPRECARLMGFDRPGQTPFVIPDAISDTQAYRQFGNSVVVPIVEQIARVMVPRILNPERYPPVQKPQLELGMAGGAG